MPNPWENRSSAEALLLKLLVGLRCFVVELLVGLRLEGGDTFWLIGRNGDARRTLANIKSQMTLKAAFIVSPFALRRVKRRTDAGTAVSATRCSQRSLRSSKFLTCIFASISIFI